VPEGDTISENRAHAPRGARGQDPHRLRVAPAHGGGGGAPAPHPRPGGHRSRAPRQTPARALLRGAGAAHAHADDRVLVRLPAGKAGAPLRPGARAPLPRPSWSCSRRPPPPVTRSSPDSARTSWGRFSSRNERAVSCARSATSRSVAHFSTRPRSPGSATSTSRRCCSSAASVLSPGSTPSTPPRWTMSLRRLACRCRETSTRAGGARPRPWPPKGSGSTVAAGVPVGAVARPSRQGEQARSTWWCPHCQVAPGEGGKEPGRHQRSPRARKSSLRSWP